MASSWIAVIDGHYAAYKSVSSLSDFKDLYRSGAGSFQSKCQDAVVGETERTISKLM